MAKHKPMCFLVSLLVIVGALNWGLAALGYFLKTNLNVVNLILGGLAGGLVENIVYLVVGLAGLAFGYMYFSMKECSCEMDEMKK